MAKKLPPEVDTALDTAIRAHFESEGALPIYEQFKEHISLPTIYHRARKLGLKTQNGRQNQAKSQSRSADVKWAPVKEILRQRYEVEGPLKLSQELNVPPTTLFTLAGKMGLKVKDPYGIRSRHNHSVNYDYFNAETLTPNAAYILGYTYADGSISQDQSTLTFHCTQADDQLIRDIIQELDSTHKISDRAAYSGKRNLKARPSTGVQISHSLLVKSLVDKYGLQPNKSNLDLPLPTIPDDVFNHFTRGFSDGDGTVAVNNRQDMGFGLYATFKFLTSLQRAIVRLVGVPELAVSPRTDCKYLYECRWQSRTDLLKLYYWLYPPGDYLYLQRKRDRFTQQIQTYNPTNPSVARDSTTGYSGVSQSRFFPYRWRAKCHVQGKDYYLGEYDTTHEAAFAYNLALQRTNSPSRPNQLVEVLGTTQQAKIKEQVLKFLDF